MNNGTWLAWTVLVLHVHGVLGTVYAIGKEREPITPGTAVLAVLISGAVIGLAVRVLVGGA